MLTRESSLWGTHFGQSVMVTESMAIRFQHWLKHNYQVQFNKSIIENLCKILKEDEPEPSLTRAFAITNKEVWSAELDTNLSGSTTVALLIKDNKIWSANVGDSRAILCRHSESGWRAIQLSNDHKPSEEREKQRIIGLGGRIEAQKGFFLLWLRFSWESDRAWESLVSIYWCSWLSDDSQYGRQSGSSGWCDRWARVDWFYHNAGG